MSPTGRLVALALAALGLALASGCGPSGGPPELGALGDQIVAVNQELVLVVTATDPDGDELDFGFDAEVDGISRRAQLGRLPNGAAEFRWTPLAADVGVWPFDFTVSDGIHEDTITIQIDVRSAIGDGSAPTFVHPAGMGTTLDLTAATCLDFDVEVFDADTPEVILGLGEPVVEGAELVQLTGTMAEFHWCPTAAQIEADDRYPITFTADDRDNPLAQRPFLVVLRRPAKPDCPGDPPVIAHTAGTASTLLPLRIEAQVSDDQGLKREPLLYWSLAAPGAAPDLGAMNQVPMQRVAGTLQAGTWAADVPSPVAGLGAGQSRTLHYVVVATDDDDPVGTCDHETIAPSSAAFAMPVTNPGGEGGAPECSRCTHDVQCGGAADLCVAQGTAGDAFCLDACGAGGTCPSGYACSTGDLTSVGGAKGRMCVPISGQCSLVSCVDDAREDNDSRAQADAKARLPVGQHDLVSCPASSGLGDDEDFFEIATTAEGTIFLELTGTDATDVDLALQDVAGTTLDSSVSFTSSESLAQCVPAGTYYVRVFAFGSGSNPYELSYQHTPGACPEVCEADENEDDDSPAQARGVAIRPTPHSSTTQSICPEDDDWYRVQLTNGERLVADLIFDQQASDQDLDLHVHDAAGVDLTPCSPDSIDTCDLDNGQSGDSDEHLEFVAPTTGCAGGCTFFVRVTGFDGSANLYDLTLRGVLP